VRLILGKKALTNDPHPPLRGTFFLVEKEYNHPLSHGERVAEVRVSG